MPGSRSFDRLSPGPATNVSSHSFSAAWVSLSVSSMQSEEGFALLHVRNFQFPLGGDECDDDDDNDGVEDSEDAYPLDPENS